MQQFEKSSRQAKLSDNAKNKSKQSSLNDANDPIKSKKNRDKLYKYLEED